MGLHHIRVSSTTPRRAQVEEVSNTLGALIFVAYVAAAFFISAFIARDLINAYVYLPRRLRERKGLFKEVQIFTTLAILSFSVLSYHMLDYLIESYSSWAIEKRIALPQQVYGKTSVFGPYDQRTPLYIWTWLRTSTLFTNFARTICSPQEHACWTSQALFMTMSWNVIFNFEGSSLKISALE